MLTKVLDASVSFVKQMFATPLILSSGPITQITEARVTVRVRTGALEATGYGSIYLSDLWSWPEPTLTHEQRDEVLRSLCTQIARDLPTLTGEPAHPIELGLRLHNAFCHTKPGPNEPTLLAKAMCLSPFDAAIHDAAGRSTGLSAFDFYNDPMPIPSADHLFPGRGAARALQTLVLKSPLRKLAAWYVAGKNDNLEKDIKPWIVDRGYHCIKIKTLGKSGIEDAQRTADIYNAVKGWATEKPRLSVDSNEGHPDTAAVLDYLEQLRRISPDAYAALEYFEQPTGRDIEVHAFQWDEVTKRKPVLLDEGLTSLELLPLAQSQGWSGLALKTCKGHSFALIAAAWAHERDMLLAMQDLTNPGNALVHSALFAAYVPTINGIELNSPQFTPSANVEWQMRWPKLVNPTDGYHRLPELPVGLGALPYER